MQYSMTIENVELKHKYCPQQLHIGTVRMKLGKETKEIYKQKMVKFKEAKLIKKKEVITP